MHDHFAFGKFGSGLDEKFLNFTTALIVTPVSYPQNVRAFLGCNGVKSLHIGALVKCPRIRHSEALRINLADRLTKREHSVKQMHMEAQQFTRTAIRAVMGIVKKCTETKLVF